MAKKTVATLRKAGGAKDFAKVIVPVKTESGAYTFKEEMVPAEQVQDTLNRK